MYILFILILMSNSIDLVYYYKCKKEHCYSEQGSKDILFKIANNTDRTLPINDRHELKEIYYRLNTCMKKYGLFR
jgi:hypothetical protein